MPGCPQLFTMREASKDGGIKEAMLTNQRAQEGGHSAGAPPQKVADYV